MTKQEAIQAMKEGKKVTHRYFGKEEWMTSDSRGREIRFEDGVRMSDKEFWHFRDTNEWQDGYSLFEPKKNA